MNIWRKKIKDTKDIADRTGIEEKKIKELKKGEREIEGETMEKVLKAINDSDKETKIEKQVKEKMYMDWCYSTDINQIIRDFGYQGQRDVGLVIGLSQTTISNIVNHKYPSYVKHMKTLYDFFHNDFNKKKKGTPLCGKRNVEGMSKEEEKEIRKWYKNNKLRNLMDKYGIKTYLQLANLINHAASSVSELGSKQPKYISAVPYDVYYYFKKLEEGQKEPAREQKDTDSVNVSGENETTASEAKNGQKEDVKINQEPEKPKKKKLLKKYRCLKLKSCLDELQIRGMQDRIDSLERQNQKLKLQIKRYEKLIDNLK